MARGRFGLYIFEVIFLVLFIPVLHFFTWGLFSIMGKNKKPET